MPDLFPMLAHNALHDREYSCHAVRSRARWDFKPHRHIDCYDLTYVDSGVVEQRVNGCSAALRPGMTTLVRPGDTHYIWGTGVVMYTINFRDESLRVASAFLGMQGQVGQLLQAPSAPLVETSARGRSGLLLDLENLVARQCAPHSEQRFRGFLARWLVALSEQAAIPRFDELPGWIATLIGFLEENVEMPVTVADLVRYSGRTPEHVARSFRKHLGVTPSGAINRARLDRAALLLRHTNRSILDICYGLGYSSPSYFHRLFRRVRGVPPGRYRREAR